MKKYIIPGVILIYLSIVASQEMKIIGLAICILLAIAALIATGFGVWVVMERMKILRAKRIEAEKQANVLTVTANGQVFIRETDHRAWWRAAHLDNRVYANSQDTYENPDQKEIEAWQQFNRPKTIEKALQLPSIVLEGVPKTLYEILDTCPHLMLVGGTNSGKTTQINHTIEYLTKKNPSARVCFLSTHAGLDINENNIHSKAVVIQQPDQIIQALNDLFKTYEHRRDNAGQYCKLIVALDEWAELIDEHAEAGNILRRMSRGARKTNINLILASHGANVGDLGIKGHSSVKEDFAEIYLDSKSRDKAFWQHKTGKVEIDLPGGDFNDREAIIIELETIEKQVLGMLADGHSHRDISQVVWGQHGQFYNEKIDAIAEKS